METACKKQIFNGVCLRLWLQVDVLQAFMVGFVFAKMSQPKQRTQTLLFSRSVLCTIQKGTPTALSEFISYMYTVLNLLVFSLNIFLILKCYFELMVGARSTLNNPSLAHSNYSGQCHTYAMFSFLCIVLSSSKCENYLFVQERTTIKRFIVIKNCF